MMLMMMTKMMMMMTMMMVMSDDDDGGDDDDEGRVAVRATIFSRETIFRSIVDREPEDGKVELAKLMKSVEHEPHLKALVQGELRFWSQPVEPPEMGKWLSAERQFGALVAKADDPFRLVASTLRGKFSGKDLAGLALQIATEDEKQHGFMKKVSDNLCDRLPLPSIREQPRPDVEANLKLLTNAVPLRVDLLFLDGIVQTFEALHAKQVHNTGVPMVKLVHFSMNSAAMEHS